MNASEGIRTEFCLLQKEESKLVILEGAIEDVFASGIAKKFNAKKHLNKLKSAKQKMTNYTFTNKAVENLSRIWD